MPSETDPLLPKRETAPEISGHGFSSPSQSQYQIQNEVVDSPEYMESESEQNPPSSYGNISPLRSIFAIFVVVVGLAIFVSLVMPGAFEFPWVKFPKDDTLTVKARVDKILSETPLIGPPVQFIRHHVGTNSNGKD